MGVVRILAVLGLVASMMVGSAEADKGSRKVRSGQWFGLAPVNPPLDGWVDKTEEGYVLVVNGQPILFSDVKSLEMFLNEYRAGL